MHTFDKQCFKGVEAVIGESTGIKISSAKDEQQSSSVILLVEVVVDEESRSISRTEKK